MGKITELLDALNVSEEKTEELYDIFRMVPDFDVPLIRFSLDKGVSLIRQRINKKGGEYYRVSELGYPPKFFFTEFHNPPKFCNVRRTMKCSDSMWFPKRKSYNSVLFDATIRFLIVEKIFNLAFQK